MANIYNLLTPKSEEEIRNSMNNPIVLHAACNGAASGNKSFLTQLIKLGFDINIKDEYGWALIHYASHSSHTDIVELLIQFGADVNDKTKSGKTPIYLASRFPSKYNVELLLRYGAKE